MNRKLVLSIISIIFIGVMGLSVILNEINFFSKININFLLFKRTLDLFEFIIYIFSTILAWQLYKKERTNFFKWLTIALSIGLVISIKNYLWIFIVSSWVLTQKVEFVQTANIISTGSHYLLITCLFAFIVYAVSNYKESNQKRFNSVFKWYWIALFAFVYIFLLIAMLPQVSALFGEHKVPTYAALFSIDIFRILIVSYGMYVILKKQKIFEDNLLKWLTTYLRLEIVYSVIVAINNVLQFSRLVFNININFNFIFYITHILSSLIPIFIVIALITYRRNKEYN
ncbi:MAG: hypothetical protein K9L17_00735 [Clostridiales bacterium]|nr:hypothetical protein [Clostridiales bacterium]MCF8021218.1 hypothetical protein [Clostridiales bacterium]